MSVIEISKYLGIIAYTLLATFYLIKLIQEAKKGSKIKRGRRSFLFLKLLVIAGLFGLGILTAWFNEWAITDVLVISIVVISILVIELYHLMAIHLIRVVPDAGNKAIRFLFNHKNIPIFLHVSMLALLFSYFGLKKVNPWSMGVKDRLIVVESDYGDNLDYEGEVLGVIHGIAPNARVHFLSSSVSKFDVENASWNLWRSSRYFPEGTIFLALTNPGGEIGTSNNLALETKNGQIFIGVDKGVFDHVVEHYGYKQSVLLSNEKFHYVPEYSWMGIDGTNNILAPAAALLSKSGSLKDLGKVLSTYEKKLPVTTHCQVKEGTVQSRVMSIDTFGNVNLNIYSNLLDSLGIKPNSRINISFRDTLLSNVSVLEAYSNVKEGEPVAIINGDILQLAINLGDFSKKYGIKAKDDVKVKLVQN